MTEQVSFMQRVLKSFLFFGAGNASTRVLNAIALIYALKELSQADLGLATLVMAILAIVQAATELGLGAAVVQRKELSREQLDSLFWVGLVLSCAVYGVIALSAPLAARFYDSPELSPMLMVYGSAIVISALFVVPRSLMVRDLHFGRLAVIDNVAAVVGAITLVALVYRGYGAWALVLAELATKAVQFVLSIFAVRYVPKWRFDFEQVRSMVHFGMYVTGSRLLYNVYVNADYLVVGKLFGGEVLGVYGFAYKFVSDTVKALASITNAVAYPTFARVADDMKQLRGYYFGIARASMMLVGTVLVVLALHAEGLLRVVGYDQWLESIPFIQLFAIVGVLRCVSPLVPQLLNAVGQARLNFYYSLSNAIFMPAAFVVGGLFGPFGVAYAWLTAYPLVVLLLFWYGSRVLELPLATFVTKTFTGVVVLPVVVLVTLAYQLLVAPSLDSWPPVQLALGVLVTAATGFGLVWRMDGRAAFAILKKQKPKATS